MHPAGRGQVAVGRLFFKGWGTAMHRCLAGRSSSELSAERPHLLMLMWRPGSLLEGLQWVDSGYTNNLTPSD